MIGYQILVDPLGGQTFLELGFNERSIPGTLAPAGRGPPAELPEGGSADPAAIGVSAWGRSLEPLSAATDEGSAGVGEGPSTVGSEPVGAMVRFESSSPIAEPMGASVRFAAAARTYSETVLRSIPSVRAIRRFDQPRSCNISAALTFAIFSRFAIRSS